MYCQFEQLRDRNVVVKCFNQALYHVSSAEIHSHNYCEHHIQKLPRKTKLELLFDVIELPPSDEILPYNIIRSSAGLVTSNKISNALHHLASHERDMNSLSSDEGMNSNMSRSDNEPHAFTIANLANSHGEARVNDPYYSSKVIKDNFVRPFENLGKLCECYGYLPRPKTWRMLPFAIPGEINGLPGSHGMALATNGVHIAIENSTYSELFFGHLDYFVIDDLSAPAGSINTLQQAAESGFKPVRNQLKQFDELFL